MHLPHSGLDRRNLTTIADASAGDIATLHVTVDSHQPSPRGSRAPWKINVSDATGHMQLIFFNYAPWLKKKYLEGEDIIISGKVEGLLTEKQMVHPEAYSANADLGSIARIWPVYNLTSGITQNMMGKAVFAVHEHFQQHHNVPDWLGESTLKAHGWPSFKQALADQHQPQSMENFDHHHPSTQRLAFDELLAWQLALLKARDKSRLQKGIAHPPALKLRQQMLDTLPFILTGDQNKVIGEIDADMMRPLPMLRLLQGDVGAGKTLVAFAAILRAVEAGYQATMMAPTEILAIQHHENAQKYFNDLGIKTALLKGKMKAKEKRDIKEAIASGEVDVIFGTHALIEDTVIFKKLSLAVIDEQHRFGVRQRLSLSAKGHKPDILVMTATPIPRTLSLTAYGDMDISILAEKPPGRQPIKTTVMAQEKLPEIAQALKRIIDLDEQIYWVCPLVEESEKSDMAAATQRFEALHKVYGDIVGLLHGRMKPAEKDGIMQSFKNGDIRILVSTTVIEVGVDVPQATTMIIEHAERFGLAQLHQLRGRVGRGQKASHCILLYAPPLSLHARERLGVMRDTEDGFLIAEKDLELRGPGETLGTQQAGHIITRIADLREDKDLIYMAREMAERWLTSDNLTDAHKDSIDFLLRFFDRDDAKELMHSG